MRKTLHKRLRPLCFTSARVEYSPSDSRLLRTVGNTSSLPPFTSHWECRVQSPLEGLNTGVISFCLQLDGPLSIKVKYIFASWVEKEDYLYSVEKCTDDFLFFLIRKFYFGLQEGIATILIRMLGCHMSAFVWTFSGLCWARLPWRDSMCTVAGQPEILNEKSLSLSVSYFESHHFP